MIKKKRKKHNNNKTHKTSLAFVHMKAERSDGEMQGAEGWLCPLHPEPRPAGR